MLTTIRVPVELLIKAVYIPDLQSSVFAKSHMVEGELTHFPASFYTGLNSIYVGFSLITQLFPQGSTVNIIILVSLSTCEFWARDIIFWGVS